MPDPDLIVSNLGFTEGPLWTSDGRLLVTSVSRGLVYEVDLTSRSIVAEIETGGGPNGLAEDALGRVWVAQNGGVTVKSRSPRAVAPGLQLLDGRDADDRLTTGCRAPNDLAEGPDGRIWFTDPGGPGERVPGRLCAFDPDTTTVGTLLEGIDFPNGLTFGLSGDVLYLAETRTRRVLHFAWDGIELSPLGVFATLSDGGADGLAVDVEGNLLVAVPEADMIVVFAPDGSALGEVRFARPTFPTNLCFAGDRRDVLVVTAAKGGRLLAIRPPGAGRGPSHVGSRLARPEDRAESCSQSHSREER